MTPRLRLVSLALFGSLAVNLFLGGLMVGRLLDHGPPFGPPHAHGGGPPPEPGGPPFWMRRAIGPDGAETLEKVWRAHAAEIDPLRADLRKAREAVSDALAAEPFDPNVYADSLDTVQDRAGRMLRAINAAMVDLAKNLTPEQRRQMVEQSREWRRHKPSQ